LAFDGKLLGQVLRIFIDTVASNYRRRQADRGIADGESGAVTVIQRANSDLRLSPHFHVLQLDGCYAPRRDGVSPIFHPAPRLTQEDVLAIVERASKRILRFLKRRGVITLVIDFCIDRLLLYAALRYEFFSIRSVTYERANRAGRSILTRSLSA
jgi:hypothetical protein